jgi:hypothetical protein
MPSALSMGSTYGYLLSTDSLPSSDRQFKMLFVWEKVAWCILVLQLAELCSYIFASAFPLQTAQAKDLSPLYLHSHQASGLRRLDLARVRLQLPRMAWETSSLWAWACQARATHLPPTSPTLRRPARPPPPPQKLYLHTVQAKIIRSPRVRRRGLRISRMQYFCVSN